MSSTYAGNSANFPTDLTLPTDGDKLRASTWRPGLEGLADRTAYLKASISLIPRLIAANFSQPVSITGSPTLNWVLYVPARRRWFTFGDARECRQSIDGGYSWSAATIITAGGGAEACCMADTDASGNMVVTQRNSDDFFTYAVGTDTWAENTASIAVAGIIADDPQMVYDSTNARWCFFTFDGTTPAYVVYTSADRVTWTAATLTNLPANVGSPRLAVNKPGGRIAAMISYYATLALYSRYSDDGGQTWSAGNTYASAISLPTETFHSYHPDSGQYLYTIGETTGTHACEVWTSTDGIAYTKVATLTSHCLMKASPLIVPSGESNTWIATTAQGYVVVSTDGGVTWQHVGIQGPLDGVWSGFDHGQMLAMTTTGSVYVGLRAGEYGDVLT